jgi:hypothetical protein
MKTFHRQLFDLFKRHELEPFWSPNNNDFYFRLIEQSTLKDEMDKHDYLSEVDSVILALIRNAQRLQAVRDIINAF